MLKRFIQLFKFSVKNLRANIHIFQTDDVHYWTCVKKRDKLQRCHATMVTRVGRGDVLTEGLSLHNHLPNPLKMESQKLRRSLKQRSASRQELPSTTIRECAKTVDNEVM